MKIILKRAGSFKCNWSGGNGLCGHGVAGEQEYSYECEIVSDSAYLDKNGFIVDQLDVNREFQEMFYPEPTRPKSCELIAIRGVLDIKDLVLDHLGPNSVSYVKVSIGVMPPRGVKGAAQITAEWSA